MYRYSLLDDEENKLKLDDSILAELLGQHQAQQTSDATLPQQGELAARDETSPTRAAKTAESDISDFEKQVAEAKAQRAARSDELAALQAGPARSTNHTAGDIDTVLAMLLDLGANKGRGLGQITGAYVSNQEANDREQRQHEERLALAQAHQKLNQDPLEELLRVNAAERGIKGLYARDAAAAGVEGRAEHNWAQNESPESAKQTTAVEVAKRKAAANVEGKTAEESALAADIQRNARGKAGATAEGSTQATTNELRANPRAVTEEEKIRNDLAAAQLEESKRGRAATEANMAETRRRADADSFRNQTKDMLVALQKARDLQKQIDAAPGKVPGLGNAEYNEPNLMLDQQAIHNQEILQQLINPETKRYFGTAVSANEATARARAYGTGRLSGEAAREEAIKTIREGLESGVRGAAIGHEDVARQILHEYGLADLLDPTGAAAVVEDAPASARDALPQTRDPQDVPATGAGMKELQQSAPSLGKMPETLRKKYDRYRSTL